MNKLNRKPIASLVEKSEYLGVIIAGPSSAGKTTVLKVMRYGVHNQEERTIIYGFHTISMNDISLLAIETGGRSGNRALKIMLESGSFGIVFVVDSSDREKIDEAREQLHLLFKQPQCQNAPFLVLANKQDLSNTMNLDELQEKLALHEIDKNIKWHLQPACAIQSEGLYEGAHWLTTCLRKNSNTIKPIDETIDDFKAIRNHFAAWFKMSYLKKHLLDNFKKLL